jgi:restriction endonuclease S subunit
MRNGWTETTLGEIAEVVMGRQLSPSKKLGLRPTQYLRAANIGSWGISLDDVLEMDFTEDEEVHFASRVGDVLLVEGGNEKSVGCPALISEREEGLCIQNTIIRCRIKDDVQVFPEFLFQVLRNSFWLGKFSELCAGTTIMHLGQKRAQVFPLILPPLDEQKRIVDLVSSVDSYIAALQQQADAARAARNAVLSELLSAGGEDWIETTLGEVAELNPEATKNFPADQVIRYIDLASVSHETGISQDLTEVKYGDAPGRARRVVRVADVLVSTVRPYLKGFALVPKDLDGGVASTGFAVVRAKPDKTLPGFIWAFVGLEPFVLHLMDRATGSNYPAVRPEDIASFKLMLPPIAEQKRIVDLVSSMDDMIKTTHHAVSNATRMRSGLLSDLLSGKHEIPESYDRLLGAA